MPLNTNGDHNAPTARADGNANRVADDAGCHIAGSADAHQVDVHADTGRHANPYRYAHAHADQDTVSYVPHPCAHSIADIYYIYADRNAQTREYTNTKL